jgi:hypothetical protein
MNRHAGAEPQSGPRQRAGAIERVIVPRSRDLGGFTVHRVLPAPERPMVGPFVFFDQMGPAAFAPGQGIDVRPHPHIGLATVTYLFEGEILHRDSLGTVQPIRPGAVNWMTAGRGIVHSERTAPTVRAAGGRVAGLQAWVALPREAEDSEPSFAHYDRDALPLVEAAGAAVRLIAGTWLGRRSPVATASPTLYADVALEAGAGLAVPEDYVERAIHVVDGEVVIDDGRVPAGTMAVLRPGLDVTVTAPVASRLMVLGGAPLDGPRTLWWNFVASTPDRIERAKADWKAGRFPAVPGDDEVIPLPAD